MGTLDTGATYIYESPDGGETVFRREFGKSEKVLISAKYPQESNVDDRRLWNDVLEQSKTVPALQKALEHAILVYKLTKNYGTET